MVLSAPSPTTGGGVPEELRRTAQELREAKGGQAVRVVVEGQVELSPGNVPEGVRQIVGAQKDRTLLVDLTASPESGQAGALLALLANERVVPSKRVLNSLQGHNEALKVVPLCGVAAHKPLCESLLKGDVKLEPGKDKPLAWFTRDAASASGKGVDGMRSVVLGKRPPPADDSARPDTTDILLIALTALLGLVALAVFKTRRPVATAGTGRPLPPGFLLSGAPTPAGRPRLAVVRRPSDGPVRPAVVRTCLRPQGYVEFDGWLHRATWAEPSLTPPGPGARVDVVGPESGRLEAFMPGGPGHVDGHARGSTPP